MNPILAKWNKADEATALDALLSCCGAHRWAQAIVALRPFEGVETLSLTADEVWSTMEEDDWLEAFACHPRIGEREGARGATKSAEWSQQEQSLAATAANPVLAELAERNTRYEQRFGFRYIVCATGKGAEEMLTIINRRLEGNRESELREAAEQQRQIMQIRIGKWLVE